MIRVPVVHPSSLATAALPEATIQDLATGYLQRWRRMERPLFLGLALLALLLLLIQPSRLWLYLAAVGPAVVILVDYASQSPKALPVFPFYVALQALSFACPLFAAAIESDRRVLISDALLDSCILPLLLWFAALWAGWRFTPLRWGRMRGSARPLTQALGNSGALPHWSMGMAAALQLLISSPLFWELPFGLSQGLLSPLRTLISLAAMTGAFTGSYAWAKQRLINRWLWLGLFLVPVLSAITSLLLSSLQAIFFAALLGMWLGRARRALPLTLAVLLLLAFLNTGKSAIREIYWAGGQPLPSNPIALLQQWASLSLDALQLPAEQGAGNLFTDRFNNLQNLLYVQQQLAAGIPTLDGESLAVIPQVLVPRILDEEKVRAQQGQVLLNLHFGRQGSLADTEKAYIAWGFLAEGVGNFGSVFGPLLMGLATGLLLRITENLGRAQLILSTPGLLSLALTIFWLTSYEMVASTFVAAAFQITVVVLATGWWLTRRSA